MSSQHASLFEGLPSPPKGALTVYIFGPGFGEAQVVALPDGRWVVVDSCEMPVGSGEHGRVNLPLELLRHFEAPCIDLLVVSHPDKDHIKGLPRLISGCEVKRLWRYPGFQTSRDILVELKREAPFPGLDEMLAACDAMLPLMDSHRGHEVCYNSKPWPSDNDARGWSGVINNLREDGELHLIQGLRLVKNAHHGSAGAFSEAAWTHHAKGAPVELAVATRFNRGKNPPPQRGGLAPLQRFASRLALCSAPMEGWGQVVESGWVRVAHPAGPGRAACVAVTLTAAPPAKVSLSAQGALFEPASSPAL